MGFGSTCTRITKTALSISAWNPLLIQRRCHLKAYCFIRSKKPRLPLLIKLLRAPCHWPACREAGPWSHRWLGYKICNCNRLKNASIHGRRAAGVLHSEDRAEISPKMHVCGPRDPIYPRGRCIYTHRQRLKDALYKDCQALRKEEKEG